MNGLIVVVCWIVGGTLAGLVLWKLAHVGAFTITKVRIDPEFEDEERLRKAAIDAAFKTNGRHIVRADFQRGNFK